jgi:hypothetical protein
MIYNLQEHIIVFPLLSSISKFYHLDGPDKIPNQHFIFRMALNQYQLTHTHGEKGLTAKKGFLQFFLLVIQLQISSCFIFLLNELAELGLQQAHKELQVDTFSLLNWPRDVLSLRKIKIENSIYDFSV